MVVCSGLQMELSDFTADQSEQTQGQTDLLELIGSCVSSDLIHLFFHLNVSAVFAKGVILAFLAPDLSSHQDCDHQSLKKGNAA